MEITERSLERLITCSILLEDACKNNSMALHAVKLMREELEQVGQAGPVGQVRQVRQQCGTTPDSEEVRLFGRTLIENGATLAELIRDTMECFGMSQHELARMLGISQGNISRFLNSGKRRDSVMAATAGFFGDNHKGLED